MNFENVYFITGTAYAGKSTMVKLLAQKFDGIACEENYHDVLLPELDAKEFPCVTYTRDLQDWHEFIRRSPQEYKDWIDGAARECEILELRILEDMLKNPETQNKKIFVDTNISIETLHKIAKHDHVLIMLADPDISVRRFFERPDKDHAVDDKGFDTQFLAYEILHFVGDGRDLRRGVALGDDKVLAGCVRQFLQVHDNDAVTFLVLNTFYNLVDNLFVCCLFHSLFGSNC